MLDFVTRPPPIPPLPDVILNDTGSLDYSVNVYARPIFKTDPS